MMQDFIEYFWFSLKLALLLLPFEILGIIVSFFVPTLPPLLLGGICTVTFAFGFVLMVHAEDDEISGQEKRLVQIGKCVFLPALCLCLGALFHDIDYEGVARVASLPLAFIATKIFFRTQIVDWLS